jgi:hypothetical protein
MKLYCVVAKEAHRRPPNPHGADAASSRVRMKVRKDSMVRVRPAKIPAGPWQQLPGRSLDADVVARELGRNQRVALNAMPTGPHQASCWASPARSRHHAAPVQAAPESAERTPAGVHSPAPLPSRADGSTIAGDAQHLSPLRI